MAEGWAPFEPGWAPDPVYAPFVAHPSRPGWLRAPDGRWFDRADVAEGRVRWGPQGPEVVPGWIVVAGRFVRERGDHPAKLDFGSSEPMEEETLERLREAARHMGLIR